MATTIGAVGIALLLLSLALRVPIGFALGGVSVLGILAIRGPSAAMGVFATLPYDFVAHWSLSAVPMFILMGTVAYHSGLTNSLYRAARLWLSGLPGGLAVASTTACAMFAAASGSSVATASAMGRIAIPEMLKYGYDKGLATGCVAAAGTLGSLIPPSILMILYAIFAEVSIGKMLIAGILPGIVSAVMFVLMIATRCKLRPHLAPPMREAISWSDRFDSLRNVWPLPVLILGVLGGIYSGIFTPTEAGAGGALIATLIAAAQRRLTWHVIKISVVDSLKATSTIFFIAMGAILLTRFMAFSGIPTMLDQVMQDYAVNQTVLVILTSVIYIILGMFLDSLGLMLLTLPVLLPLFEATDASLIWFGVLVIKYLEIGLITPPVGLNVYVIKSVVGDAIPLETIFRGIWWFVATEVVTLTILIMFPEISLILPELMD